MSSAAASTSNPSRCPGCGADNGCALAAGAAAQTCWCMQAPSALPVPPVDDTACYCSTCLRRLAGVEPDHAG